MRLWKQRWPCCYRIKQHSPSSILSSWIGPIKATLMRKRGLAELEKQHAHFDRKLDSKTTNPLYVRESSSPTSPSWPGHSLKDETPLAGIGPEERRSEFRSFSNCLKREAKRSLVRTWRDKVCPAKGGEIVKHRRLIRDIEDCEAQYHAFSVLGHQQVICSKSEVDQVSRRNSSWVC